MAAFMIVQFMIVQVLGAFASTDEQRESIQMITRSARDLLRLVTNILDRRETDSIGDTDGDGDTDSDDGVSDHPSYPDALFLLATQQDGGFHRRAGSGSRAAIGQGSAGLRARHLARKLDDGQ